MRSTGRVLLVGAAAAGVAVTLLVVFGAPSTLIPTAALGAAIPVAFIYAVMTAVSDADAYVDEESHG